MNIVGIIEKKKQGLALSREEISFFVQGVCDGSIADYQTSAFLMAVCFVGMNDDETLWLTEAMRDSGDKIVFPHRDGDVYVDKHSTGGVGDSTTFVVLPAVAACGLKAPKMSGRGLGHTGGTIDKLAAIDGFRTELTPEEFERQVEEIGLAVVSQSAAIAKADKILYALRDVTATVDSIPLITSSIMSKKLAGGADVIVLDVKCGSGAFMKDADRAAELARALKRVGELAGKKVSPVVTDMNQPLDVYVGNSLEILGALCVLKGEKNDLYRVAKRLSSEIVFLGGKADSLKAAEELFDEVLSSGAALSKFRDMVIAQGGDPAFIDDERLLLRAKHEADVTSLRSGVVSSVDCAALGNALVDLGGGRRKKSDDIDLWVGYEMKVRLGDKVETGAPLVHLYYDGEYPEAVVANIRNAIRLK